MPGYDAPRIAHLLGELPVEVLGRMRSDRVLRRSTPARAPGTTGRPSRHGGEFVFADPTSWGTHQAVTTTDTRRYRTVTAQAWDRLHPRLTRRAAWTEHAGPLPIIEGTVIRLTVEHLPSGGDAKPVWLWWSRTNPSPADIDRCWQVFLRRFDIEHTFKLTPARVRRGFRNIRTKTPSPARAPKPSKPGPGRPSGSKNRRSAPRHDIGRILATGEAYSRPTNHKKGTKPRRTG